MICEDKTVAIVGCGGLGGFVAEYATRLGFKKIILIDGDKFSKDNLNRQLLSATSTIGKYKVKCYYKHLKDVSPNTEIVAINKFIKESNVSMLNEADLIFDCLDNIKVRKLLEKHCEIIKKPIVHGAIGEKFGNACLCLPGENTLKKLYKDTLEMNLKTQCHAVALIASIQVEIAMKYFLNKYAEIKDKLIYFDLEDFEIQTLKI